jgi:serine phosphatase RsbU (regulator of sigma subunit)
MTYPGCSLALLSSFEIVLFSSLLEEEMAMDRKIRLGLLPEECPSASGWEFTSLYQPAHRVGGNFNDFFELPNRSI